jgi:hypothetical protein
MNQVRLIVPTLLLLLPVARIAAAEPALEARLPLKPEIRKIFDNSCTFCHGDVVAGEKEIRGDVDLTTDAEIKATVLEIGRLKQYILEDKMPQKPRLSRRLRSDPAMQERLDKLRADYDKNGEKAVLLAWLDDVVATTGEKKE